MITIPIFKSVLFIRYYSEATGFVMEIGGQQFLITAKHLLTGKEVSSPIEESGKLDIFISGKWNTVGAVLLGHHPNADVSVLSLATTIPEGGLVQPTKGGFTIGQEMYFLGFPYSFMDQKRAKSVLNDKPLPLVKRAILSGIIDMDSQEYLVLDGINNPGFSGGPVICKVPGEEDFGVVGVVSGYHSVDEKTYQQNGEEFPITYRYNTGLILASKIQYVLDILEN